MRSSTHVSRSCLSSDPQPSIMSSSIRRAIHPSTSSFHLFIFPRALGRTGYIHFLIAILKFSIHRSISVTDAEEIFDMLFERCVEDLRFPKSSERILTLSVEIQRESIYGMDRLALHAQRERSSEFK